MVAAFVREGVPTQYIVYDHGKKTNYSTILDYSGDRTILVYHDERHYSLPKLKKTKWIYFSSISGNHEEFNDELVAHVKKHRIKLAFNPGTMQMRLGIRKLMPILGVTDTLFVNKEEAETLVGEKKDIPSLMHALEKKGPRTVVVTNGKKGSYSLHNGAVYHAGLFRSDTVERTGCGDAYASGFLAATIQKLSTIEAMRWGTMNAASVVEHIGSRAGLLTSKSLERRLSEQPDFMVE